MDKSLYLMEDLPEQERPRERLKNNGPEALSDAELLAILLRTGLRHISTLDLARDILNHFDGCLLELSRTNYEELLKIKGIGPAKASSIHAAFCLARRLSSKIMQDKPHMNNSRAIANYLRDSLAQAKQEEFHVISLNAKNVIMKDRLISRGLIDRSPVHAREVFREAVRTAAAKIILAHNHPSGDPSPSPQDITTTNILIDSGELLGIPIVDHIIIGKITSSNPLGYISLRESRHCHFSGF